MERNKKFTWSEKPKFVSMFFFLFFFFSDAAITRIHPISTNWGRSDALCFNLMQSTSVLRKCRAAGTSFA